MGEILVHAGYAPLRDEPPREKLPVARPVRAAKMIALAHRMQALLDEGAVADQAELAAQPLPRVIIVEHDPAVIEAMRTHAGLIAEELNVKHVDVREDDGELCTLSFKPNFKRLGKWLGKRMKDAAKAVSGLTRADFEVLQGGGTLEIVGEAMTLDDVLVTREAKGEVVLEAQRPLTVALETHLDEALIQEGPAREVISRVQRLRKDSDLEVTDRIALTTSTR